MEETEHQKTWEFQETEFSWNSNCVHSQYYPHTRPFNLGVHLYDRFGTEVFENLACNWHLT